MRRPQAEPWERPTPLSAKFLPQRQPEIPRVFVRMIYMLVNGERTPTGHTVMHPYNPLLPSDWSMRFWSILDDKILPALREQAEIEWHRAKSAQTQRLIRSGIVPHPHAGKDGAPYREAIRRLNP